MIVQNSKAKKLKTPNQVFNKSDRLAGIWYGKNCWISQPRFLDNWGLQDTSGRIIPIQTSILACTTKKVKKSPQMGLEIFSIVW